MNTASNALQEREGKKKKILKSKKKFKKKGFRRKRQILKTGKEQLTKIIEQKLLGKKTKSKKNNKH